ncbi:MAG: hypothetical protein O3B42_08165 [Actinomycetota bacterium]|nr:hypothetical protein [Actinomycetota bacterium]
MGARASEEGSHKYLRIPAKWTIRKLAKFFSGTTIPDLNSGLRAFRREVAVQFLHLLLNGFSHVTTLTMAFLANGYAVRYVEIDYATRSGRSEFRFVSDTRLYLQQATRMVMMWNRLRVLTPVASVMFLVGLGKIIYDIFDKSFRIGTNTLLVMVTAGLIAIVALLADLVVQVSRPRGLVLPEEMDQSGGPDHGSSDFGGSDGA